jgi:DNA polymerase-4
VRLLGVGYAGLASPGPDELFPTPPTRGHPTPVQTSEAPPDAPGIVGAPTLPASRDDPGDAAAASPVPGRWVAGMDVAHANCGHGWVQGAGAGRVTVRFETRATGPGRARSFATTDPDLAPADPLESLGRSNPGVAHGATLGVSRYPGTTTSGRIPVTSHTKEARYAEYEAGPAP